MQENQENAQMGLDKSTITCYNTIMKNNTTLTKENEMNTQWKSTIGNLRSYQGSIVHVVSESEYWNEAKVCFTSPKGKQPTGIFTVGLPRLKKLGLTNKPTSDTIQA